MRNKTAWLLIVVFLLLCGGIARPADANDEKVVVIGKCNQDDPNSAGCYAPCIGKFGKRGNYSEGKTRICYCYIKIGNFIFRSVSKVDCIVKKESRKK
ncbi:MAG: hypothetical protein JW737_03340 [Acidobacteria bacterium]|nr:hypothetical protein [Acidobacteriota bacterium]